MSTTLTDRIQRLDSESIRTDKLQVGPRGTVLGDAWQTYTPTITGGTPNAATAVVGRFSIIGRTCVVKFTLRQTVAGTVGSGVYTVSLPPTVSAVFGTFSEAVGSATLAVSGPVHLGVVVLRSASALGVQVMTETVAPTFWGSSLGGLDETDLTATFTATFEIAN